jgi:hypothetical protein
VTVLECYFVKYSQGILRVKILEWFPSTHSKRCGCGSLYAQELECRGWKLSGVVWYDKDR